MKKIALLYTLLCVGALNGMEPENIYLSNLPEDVRNEIIKMALATSNNLKEAIKTVKVAEVLRGVRYDNLKDFTKLVHALADKFNETTEKVARKFDTTLANEYTRNGYYSLSDIKQMLSLDEKDKCKAEKDENIQNSIVNRIQKGSDVNFTGDLVECWFFFQGSALSLAIMYSSLVGVEFLLKNGAIITDETLSLAEKMINFTDVNVLLTQRVQNIKNYEDLIQKSQPSLIRGLLNSNMSDKNRMMMHVNAVKIYNLLLESKGK